MRLGVLAAATTGALGLGLGPEDPCYDPQHPYLLPNWLHDAYECQCKADEGRDIEQLCVFAMPGGTPTNYVKPKDVPNVLEIAAQTPGKIAGSLIKGAGTGTAEGLGIPDTLLWVGIGLAVLVVLPSILPRR